MLAILSLVAYKFCISFLRRTPYFFADIVRVTYCIWDAYYCYLKPCRVFKVYLSKSSLIPIGEVPNIQYLASFFGCEFRVLPYTYLGLPLGASFKSHAVWNTIVQRLQKDSQRENLRCLKEESWPFLQRTLWSLPIYYMSLFTILASIATRLEKIMRDFLWSKHDSCNSIH